MIEPTKEDVKLLFEHYDKYVEFIPGIRYHFQNIFIHKDFPQGFASEEIFRKTLKTLKPFFIANKVDITEYFFIDIDYKLTEFTDDIFEKIVNDVYAIDDIVTEMYTIKDKFVVFSGRGIHIYYRPTLLDEIPDEVRKIDIALSKDPYIIFMEVTINYILNKLRVSGKKELAKKIDTTVVGANRLMRTVGSINDRSFLPVVKFEFSKIDEINIDKILNAYTNPREFMIEFTKPVKFRLYDSTVIKRKGVIDEYELLKHLLLNNYYVKSFREV